MTQQNAEPDLEQIQVQLRQASQKVAEECWKEIHDVCQRYKCNLVAIPRIGEDGRITALIRVIPVTNEP